MDPPQAVVSPANEAAPSSSAARASKISPRVHPDDDRVELFLLPFQKQNDDTAQGEFKQARTDAELRLFIEDEIVLRVKQDFSQLQIPDDVLKEYASRTVKHLQIELDMNIERFHTEDRPLDPKYISERTALLAFRFERFLRSIKDAEDREFAKARIAQLDQDKTLKVIERMKSQDLGAPVKLPTNIVEHMLKVGMEEHLKLIKSYLLGDDEALGITVSFKDLTVSRRIPILAKDENKNKRLKKLEKILRPPGPQTVWSASANILFGCCFSLAAKASRSGPRVKDVQMLKSLNGIIEPAKITLVLGAPHAGKTQLLHALCRHTKTKGPITVSGDVYYNGHRYEDVYAPNICTLVEQFDIHIPTLTVRETLEFAFRCRGAPMLSKDKKWLEKRKLLLEKRVDFIMAVLGLTRVADTIIGNESIKGISGGECRRVTLGEMLVCGSKVLLLDEISTGLDSAATFDITKSIRAMCKTFSTTCMVCLLQPPPETVDLFDNILLMAKGNIVYHGPRVQIKSHFEKLNFICPREMDLADFLIEVSLKETDRLVEAYKSSESHQLEMEILAKDPNHLQAKNAHPESILMVSGEDALMTSKRFPKKHLELLGIVIDRQWTIMIRNVPFLVARVAQNVVMGLLLGALFFDIPFQDFYLVAMVLSQVCSLTAFSTMALLGSVQSSRNTYYKQSKQNFFPALTYVLSDYIVGLPFSLMDAMLLGTLTYFMSGLSLLPNGQPYFVFLVIYISFSVCMATITRFFGYIAPSQNVAFAMAVFFNVIGLIFSGSVATPSIIPAYFIWIYWAFSPFAWAYRSLMQNQFYANEYQAQCASGCPNNLAGQCVSYCGLNLVCPQPYPSVTCGVYFLQARQVETATYFLWLGAGMLWIYTILFLAMSALALRYVRWDGPSTTTLQEDAAAEVGAEVDQTSVASGGNVPAAAVVVDPESQQPVGAAQTTAIALEEFKPKPLIWKDIVYSIDLVPKHSSEGQDEEHNRRGLGRPQMETVDLLKHINGFAKPFTLTALMGSSGAGKTTLLDCLCYRKTVGRISGQIILGKQRVVPIEFKKQVGYVEQFGVHSSKATVRESLEFSALMRLGTSVKEEARRKIVEDTLDVLELRPIEHSLVGETGDPDALSFEENKRLTIAVELVANPAVLFADEPTSGLTSKEARLTMKALRKVANSGRPVVCTIHQPSGYIFSLFDRLLLLKRGGEVVFFGDLGENAVKLVDYFSAVPGVNPLPPGLNPATWMLDVIGAGVGRQEGAGMDFAEVYRLSELYSQNQQELEDLLRAEAGSKEAGDGDVIVSGESNGNIKLFDQGGSMVHLFNDERTHLLSSRKEHGEAEDEEHQQRSEGGAAAAEPQQQQELKEEKTKRVKKDKLYQVSYWTQYRALMHRNNLEYWRTPGYSLLRWLVMIFFAFVMGLTYLQQQMMNAAGVQSRVGVMNLMLLLTANYNSATIVPFVFSRRALFYREKASGMYAPFIYALTLQFVEGPYILMEVVLSVVIFYFLVGMANSAGAFFYYLFLMFFFVEFATYLGVLFSAAVGVQGAASLLTTLMIQLLVLFSGVAVPGNMLPDWLLGGYYITPVRWAMEGLISTQFVEYTQVICNTQGTPYTWLNGSAPNTKCAVNATSGQPISYYLSDVQVNACCDILPNRPLSARAYVFFGWTYPDGITFLPWLGGTNGYNINWSGYDYLYVILAGLIVRGIAIALTQYVSHQKR